MRTMVGAVVAEGGVLARLPAGGGAAAIGRAVAALLVTFVAFFFFPFLAVALEGLAPVGLGVCVARGGPPRRHARGCAVAAVRRDGGVGRRVDVRGRCAGFAGRGADAAGWHNGVDGLDGAPKVEAEIGKQGFGAYDGRRHVGVERG